MDLESVGQIVHSHQEFTRVSLEVLKRLHSGKYHGNLIGTTILDGGILLFEFTGINRLGERLLLGGEDLEEFFKTYEQVLANT